MHCTYIALLRGINVLGKNMVRKDDLKKAFEDLGFTNVKTYIQSGNVVFQSERLDLDNLTIEIIQYLKSVNGFEVQVMVLTGKELWEIISKNPYSREICKDKAFLYVTFLKSLASLEKIREIEAKKEGEEEFVIIGKAVYLYLPYGYGRTKLNNSIFENKLKVHATTRNWNTVQELGNMVED